MQVVLASNSPRRKELFKKICPTFITFPADITEDVPKNTLPREAVKLLARRKAEYVFKTLKNTGMVSLSEPVIVLGSDTAVAYENEMLGKPSDETVARNMLKTLSGKTHKVYTGVCFVADGFVITEAEESAVTFKRLTDEEICAYIATGSPMDKAGAYGIQDGAVVEKYTGSYTNIVGLPLELTEKMYEEVIKNVKIGN